MFDPFACWATMAGNDAVAALLRWRRPAEILHGSLSLALAGSSELTCLWSGSLHTADV